MWEKVGDTQQPYILRYYETFWGLNRDNLQQEIVGQLVGLGLALANYLHTQSLYLVYGANP